MRKVVIPLGDENYNRVIHTEQCIWIQQHSAIYETLAGWLEVACQRYRPSEFMFTGLYLSQRSRWQATVIDAKTIVQYRLAHKISRPQIVCINWLPNYSSWAMQEKHDFNWLLTHGKTTGVVQWVVVPQLPDYNSVLYHPEMIAIGWDGCKHTIGGIFPKTLRLYKPP